MKCRFVLSVLAAIGILALSATAAQAGDGGKPTLLTSFFICYSINGDRTGNVVDVKSPVFGADQQSVRIGKSALACAWAKLFTPGNLPAEDALPPFPQEVDPSPNPAGTLNQLKCYDVHIPRDKNSRHDGQQVVFLATDALYAKPLPLMVNGNPGDDSAGIEEGLRIRLSQVKYICGPASYFQ